MNVLFPGLRQISNRDYIFGVLIIHYITMEFLAPRLALGNLCVILFFLKNQNYISSTVRAYYKIGGSIFGIWTILFMTNQFGLLFE